MKKNKKNLKRLALAIILPVMLTACNTSKKENETGEKKYNIGITAIVEHKALDDVREGFIEELEKEGIKANIDYKNAGGNMDVLSQIAAKFKGDNKDLILAISTPAAQAVASSIENTPILFSAVTYPEKDGLVESLKNPGKNVTGTIDKADTKEQLNIFRQIDKNIKTLGVIYNSSEANSITQLEELKLIAKDEGFVIKDRAISNISEIAQALDSLLKDVDGLFLLSDNMVASAVDVVSQKLIENKKISVSAEESQVNGGILITKGLNYKKLGAQTAKMAKSIIIDKKSPKDIAVESAKDTRVVVNRETLKALGLDENLEIFKQAR